MARQIVMVALVMLSATTWGQHQHHPGGYHFSSFSGPVSGAVKEISVQNSHPPTHPPLPTHPPHHYHNHNPHHAAPQAPQAPIHHYGGTKVDYVAKPDYSFAYGVEDPHTGNNQNHKETRDGDVVKGEYSVVEPDGSIRTVTYTADSKNGFQATVHNAPPPPGYRPPQPPSTSPAPVHQYNYNHGQDYY